ncbi:hypothetical protein AGDE_07379 [Angomonas deanei]|uniref:Uncharacterized protein n=1 Tax=Angomonas deanei TaxID=59799 RepID=A0A7G2CL02_9TRYP|nr:hypothetical protein AGDE_07379 [Angomonas deanei]CAD2219747.1 hypothetical protein, conserved [Angomonas deanei]|eukprot:EPY35405.1 hypothetical protein AGDE_07379 [Angomonas deanei]
MLPKINLLVCGNPRKHTQSFDALKAYLEEHNKRTEQTKSTAHHVIRVFHLNFSKAQNKLVVCPPHAEKGLHSGEGATHNDEDTPAPADVDVVLHKVHTFGDPSAVEAFSQWMEEANKQRSALSRPPIILIDPLEKVNLLTIRSTLYRLLDTDMENGVPVTFIPRTFQWARDAGDMTPVGERSSVPSKTDVDGGWWIAKPEEGTGPAYTHHLTMWRGKSLAMPPAVVADLPKEENKFIVQEFLANALPVVVKVYCIGDRIFVKVKPTTKLVKLLIDEKKEDTPVKMDSQDGALFQKEGQVAPSSCWNKFFSKDSIAYENVLQIAHNISNKTELQLHLYGFDILLLPLELARDVHHYNVNTSHGIAAKAGSKVIKPDPQTSSEANSSLRLYTASDMFDLETETPTTLLNQSIPVTIDVNYSPATRGWIPPTRICLFD